MRGRKPKNYRGDFVGGVFCLLWAAFAFTWDGLVISRGEFRMGKGRGSSIVHLNTDPNTFWGVVIFWGVVGLVIGGIGIFKLCAWWRARPERT